MKAVFISNIPSPYQVRFCNVINNYIDIHFLFCNKITEDRPIYWQINLGEKCKILDKKKLLTFRSGRYLNLDIWQILKQINPDVIMLGGFTIPTNFLAYIWGRRHEKKIVVFTEVSIHPKKISIYKYFFPRLNAILAVGSKAYKQYQSYFPNTKILNYSYAADLEERLKINRDSTNKEIRFLYASRYIENNNPLILIRAFAELKKKYDNIHLVMSSKGPLREECEYLSETLNLERFVKFMDKLETWEEVNQIYANNHILIFPASYNSWGLVIPEAMAAGMPVITTPYVHASELLDDMSLVEPSINELVIAMEYYIVNHEEILKRGIENREKCNSETFNEKSKRLKQIFEELCGEV